MYTKIEEFIGKIFKSVSVSKDSKEFDGDHILFEVNDDEKYVMYHSQDCCESVSIDDVCGDIEDLVGFPILLAEEVSNRDENPNGVKIPDYQDSFTWTFYKLSTIKGNVTIRWYGESNGYYSESVDIKRLEK